MPFGIPGMDGGIFLVLTLCEEVALSVDLFTAMAIVRKCVKKTLVALDEAWVRFHDIRRPASHNTPASIVGCVG